MTFVEEIKSEVSRVIREARADGTVGMSRDCLWQCIRLGKASDAPRGVNAAFQAREQFESVIRNNEQFKKFTTL